MPHLGLLSGFLAAVVLALALRACVTPAFAGAPAENGAIAFDIPAQPLTRALQLFAMQSDLQILFIAESVGDRRSPEVSGRMTAQQALIALLDGTGLEAIRTGDVVVVRNTAGHASTWTLNQSETLSTSLEGIGVGTTTSPITPPDPAAVLGDALVTGTLIRGGRSASPLIVLDRAAIDRTGYASTRQLMESLPQNFGGGDNEAAIVSPGGSPLNVAMGSSINLRGLGSDSTLVLIDGHRVAPAAFGQFVDISMIPLSAVERVEVLADGASATYGSDAVGGVVNFILRDDYDLAETRLQSGAVPDGSLEEFQLSQTLGAGDESAHAFFVYDYFKRSNLDAADRDYAAGIGGPFDLLPAQEMHSLFAAAKTALGAQWAVRGTLLSSQRKADWRLFNSVTGEPTTTPTTTRQTSVALGTDVNLSESWQAQIEGHYSRNDTDRDVATNTAFQTAERNQFEVISIDAKLDGTVFPVPGGDVKVALGVNVRRERYLRGGDDHFIEERQVGAAFGELYLPLHESLELSVAARYERASDVDSTTTPKFGLLWSPADNVRLRGTYGRSFRAPALSEFDDSNLSSLLFDFPDPAAADGATLALLVSGNNPSLTPEEATTWTAGIDVQPAVAGSLTIGVTYFNTDFGDRIVAPLPGFEVLGIFRQADVYSPLIHRHPDPARVSELAALPSFFNLFGDFSPEDVEALIDRRLQNISITDVSGVDLIAAYRLPTPVSEWLVQLNINYLLAFDESITPDASTDDVLDTAYHPIDLRGRTGVTWQRGLWSASGFINYVDNYTNDTVTPPAPVGSWTTVDLQLSHVTRANGSWFDDTRVALSVQNALDEDPPFLSSPVARFQMGFDPTNASARGRVISLALTKSW